jgi:gamma-polyglutamate synthase
VLFLYVVFVTCGLGLLLGGIVEQRRHLANVERIPQRVLVNGIRGKSSVTRLTAGALRGGGLVTVAKTTGSAARFIHPDATEEPVHRKFGIANVVEQIGIVRRAAAYHPDALVIECMAVNPALQEVNQTKLIQSTIGVLCNVREDHLAEMGPTLNDVARSLSRSMPIGGVCVTAERERWRILRAEARRRNCRLVYADPESVTDEEMRGFSWITFKENVAIALAVAQLCGVARGEAMAGMVAARPDPGTVTVDTFDTGRGYLAFANLFAANDPESTLMNIDLLDERGLLYDPVTVPLTVVINCRPDRIERNAQMGQLTGRIQPERIVLIGEQTGSARAKVPRELADRVVDLGDDLHLDRFLDEVAFGRQGYGSVVTIGNIHGQGEVLLSHIAALPKVLPARVR